MKSNKYISMVIKYTEKLEKNINSELHEGTKWKHKTEQKMYWKNTSQKNNRCYDSNLLHLWQSLRV